MSDIEVTETNPNPERPCTCHPDDHPPVPCAKQYAITDCRYVAEIERLRAERDAWIETAQPLMDLVVTVALEAVAAEREACAKVVENYCGAWDDQGYALAQAIRTIREC